MERQCKKRCVGWQRRSGNTNTNHKRSRRPHKDFGWRLEHNHSRLISQHLQHTDILSNHDFILIVELSSKINDGCSKSYSSRCYPDVTLDTLSNWVRKIHTEITVPDLATEEWFNDLVFPLHFPYNGSSGHKLSITSYFKTNESGLNINGPFDNSLDPSWPPLGSARTRPWPKPEPGPLGSWCLPLPNPGCFQMVAVTQFSTPCELGGSKACRLESGWHRPSLADRHSGYRCPFCLTGPSAWAHRACRLLVPSSES